MSRTVILTLGRLPKALDLARALHRAGCRVVIAEPFSMYLAKVSNCVDANVRLTAPAVSKSAYVDELAALAAREQAALVVPVSEEAPHVAGLVGREPPGTRVYSMSQPELLAVHDKLAFILTGQRNGVTVPETAAFGTPEAEAIAASGEYLIKPRLSCAGRGVTFYPQGAPLSAVQPGEEVLVQRRVRGRELSTFSIVHEGRVLGTVVYCSVIKSGTVAVCFRRLTDQPAVERWVEQFAAGTRWSGFLSFDLMVTPEGVPYGFECNPRVNSGVHFVQEADVAAAILDPASVRQLRFRAETLRMQFYTCLTETQKRMFREGFAHHFRSLREASDVTWDARDKLPFSLMTFTAGNLLWRSFRTGRPIGEVATDDISWTA